MKFFSKMISSFFWIGFFPVAPGTLASLITVLIYKFGLYLLTWPFMLSLFIVIYVLGLAASSKYVSLSGKHDPGEVVIDEVLGQLVALFLLKPSWIMVLSAFFLFRFFDIIKPLFIKKAEKFSKGWGIMLDDIIAGMYTSIILNLIVLLT